MVPMREVDGMERWRQIANMVRTQIRLSDETFARARKLCEAREISLAELARRGIEYILSVYPPEPDPNRDSQPPKPRRSSRAMTTSRKIRAPASPVRAVGSRGRGRARRRSLAIASIPSAGIGRGGLADAVQAGVGA